MSIDIEEGDHAPASGEFVRDSMAEAAEVMSPSSWFSWFSGLRMAQLRSRPHWVDHGTMMSLRR